MPQHPCDPSPRETPVAPRTPNHRRDPGRLGRLSRRFRGLPPAHRRVVGGAAAGAALLLVVGVVTPVVVNASDSAGSEAAAQAGTQTPTTTQSTPTPTQSTVNATAITSLSSASGSVAGGTTLTVNGVDVDSVTRVVFGEQDAEIVAATSTELTVAVPPAMSFSPAQVGVSVFADTVRVDDAVLSYSYDIVSPVDAQMAYVFKHWNDYNLDEFGSLFDTDCANFASQSLLTRGWTMTDEWWADGSGDSFDFSKAWVSSTAFMDYAEEHPELATALDDTQRAQVKVGDIVQFDWDNSGDRDHTGIVSKVEQTDAGIVISYAGHTDDTDYRTVNEAITVIHPGASVYYWSIA